jgi:hypothetical protein
MLVKEQNEYVTRTGLGTPMGQLFRSYWIPALPPTTKANDVVRPKHEKVMPEVLIDPTE